MMERDEELQKLLRQWESPAPGSKLDERVWNSVRQGKRTWKWLPVAAGVILAFGLAKMWLPPNEQSPVGHPGASIATTLDATGFRPVSNGAITVVKAGERP